MSGNTSSSISKNFWLLTLEITLPTPIFDAYMARMMLYSSKPVSVTKPSALEIPFACRTPVSAPSAQWISAYFSLSAR